MASADTRAADGRAAGATREEVLAHATGEWLACRRIDVQAIAAACGVGRATVYRWFHSREQLIGEAMLPVVERRIAVARATVGGHGPGALRDTFDVVYRGLAAAPHVRAFVAQDRATAVALMTSSSGVVHPRMVELVGGLIEEEARGGTLSPALAPRAIAYAIVRMGEGMLFLHRPDDLATDLDELRRVTSALLRASF